MKFLSLVFLTFAAATASAGTIDCSDAHGNARLSSYSKEGGAHPGPGTVISSEQWSYNGEVVGAKSYLYQAASGAVNGNLGKMDEKTVKIIDDSKAAEKPYGKTIYTIQANVATSKAKKASRVDVILLCEKTVATVPIP